MVVNLIKLCVGVSEVEQLVDYQNNVLGSTAIQNKVSALRHVTRNMPKRRNEILNGGSIYWVINGLIQVRQKIIQIERVSLENGRSACALIFDPLLVRTKIKPRRAFQGWRYLESCEAPLDMEFDMDTDSILPTHVAEELKQLGLL